MVHQTPLILGLLLALEVGRGKPQDFEERWVTRPPVEYEFPHAIFIPLPSSEEFCSGSLILENWVLTAASCMHKGTDVVIKDLENSLTVYAGVRDRLDLNGTSVQKRESIKVVFPDEEKDLVYSLALIKVHPPFQLNKVLGVQHITLSTSSFKYCDQRLTKAGGYGVRDWRDVKLKSNFKKIDVRSYECNCSAEIRAAFPKASVDRWICGQAADVLGICTGDIGMGLVCDGQLQAVNLGLIEVKEVGSCEIVNKSGRECSLSTNIGLFADVCYYLEWIEGFVPGVDLPRKPCKGLAWRHRSGSYAVWTMIGLVYCHVFH